MITIQSVLLDGEACKGLVCTNERLRSSIRQTPTLEFIPILVQRSYCRINFISCRAEIVLITVGSQRIFRRCGISATVKVQDNRVSVRFGLRHILEGVGHVTGYRRSGVDGRCCGLIILVPAIGGIARIASATGGDRITQSCIAGLPNAVIRLFIERSKAHNLRTSSLTGRSIIPITLLNLVGHLGFQCIGDTVAVVIQTPNRIDGDVAIGKRNLVCKTRQCFAIGIDLSAIVRLRPADEDDVLSVLLVVGGLVAIVQIDGVIGLVVGNGCGSTGTTVGIVGQGVLRQCDLTGGDGEVDLNILATAILDRQGRAVVEGVVATVLLGIGYRGVDLDGVGPGVGVISGNAVSAPHAVNTGQIPAFFEITAGAGHAGRQRVVDRAAGKTGGDLLGNIAESTIQLRSIIGIKSVLGTTRNTAS